MSDLNNSINFQCSLITFEGLGLNNFDPVPPINAGFTTAAFPGWIALLPISSGGTGNIANLPSPITTIFFKDAPDSRDITFSNPIASIDLKFVSTDTVTMKAFDAANNLLATVSAPGNFIPPVLDNWQPLGINLSSNIISKITFTGPISNFAIDNVNICIVVASRGADWRAF